MIRAFLLLLFTGFIGATVAHVAFQTLIAWSF